MRTAIVGAGPTGLFAAFALARRGHTVTVVDRDPGPEPDGTWTRAGVMQFHHPHAFRLLVVGGGRARDHPVPRARRGGTRGARPGHGTAGGRAARRRRPGDTVCTTNPAAGRGVTTSLMQVRQLVALLGEHGGVDGHGSVPGHGSDLESCAPALDAWCTAVVRPWFSDHVACDAGLARRWAAADVDLDRRLPPDVIGAAVEADPTLLWVVGPYQAMQALPTSLDEVEPQVRAIYATGWRPTVPTGPTRDEPADLVTRAARREPAASGRRMMA